MKGITTIAALPNGAGQAAHLPAEVGEKPRNLVTLTIDSKQFTFDMDALMRSAVKSALVESICNSASRRLFL